MKRLILGTAQLGLAYGINNSNGKPPEKEANAILELAQKRGIEILDTAPVYGNGHQIIRSFHQNHQSFKVGTKWTAKDGMDFKSIVVNHLEHLGVSQLEYLLLHDFSDLLLIDDFRPINELKKSKKIKYFGVSLYHEDELESLIHHQEVDLIQLPFNLLDCSLKKRQLIRMAKEKGKIIHTRSAFLQGLFFMRPLALPQKISALATPLSELIQLAQENQLSMSQMALAFTFSFPDIAGVLIGVETSRQLEENLSLLNCQLDQKLIQRIEQVKVEHRELLLPFNW